MRFPAPGRLRSAADVRSHLQTLAVGFDLVDEVRARGALSQPIRLAGKDLDNRFCAHPMEGWDGTAEGGPSAHTLRRWRRVGRSGAALVWGGEAFAVRADGRANPNQLHLTERSEEHLSALLAELQAGRKEQGLAPKAALVGLQLTHSGRFSRPEGPFAPQITHHHPLLEERYPLPPGTTLLTDGELEGIGECYVEAARVAARAGFDFVDVKCCHGYLLHELLGSHTRTGNYGGSFENRTRLFRRIVAEIRRECPDLAIGVRLSAADTEPYQKDPETGIGAPMQLAGCRPELHHFGLDCLDEPIRFVQGCADLDIEMVNVTLGSPYWNPHLQRPAAYPPSDGYHPPVDPLLMVDRHIATVRELQESAHQIAFVGSGYTYLQEWLPHVGEWIVSQGHADFIGLGRLLLSYPELPADLIAGRPLDTKRICRTFSDCTTGPRNGMLSGCFPLDPYYKSMPEAKKVKELVRELRR